MSYGLRIILRNRKALQGLCGGKWRRFKRFGHRGINMQQIDEIIDSGVETHGHGRFVDDFPRAVANHRDAQDFIGVAVANHFDHACGAADGARARYQQHRHNIAGPPQSEDRRAPQGILSYGALSEAMSSKWL
jgi:hypothetical protein